MPAPQHIHAALCDAFIMQRLRASPVLMANHKGRFYQEVALPDPPGLLFPHVFWTGGVKGIAQATGIRGHIAKLRSVFTVRAVRKFPQGGADWSVFDRDANALRETLAGLGCTPVVLSNNQKIGEIYQSRYLGDHEMTYRDDTVRVLERGIIIEVIHL